MKWEVKVSIGLLLLSAFFYIINYLTFHDTTFIEKYILVQLGFLPISVLLVSIVLNNLMARRERKERLEKLNIVIGSFFAEIGKDLLRYLSKYDANIESLAREVVNVEDFSDGDFERLKEKLESRRYDIKVEQMNLHALRKFLLDNKEFVVNLLDNPSLMEHERFTELLWNLLHVTEELRRLMNFESLTEDDWRDIKGEIENLYRLLAYEWVNYAHYLKKNYPHIFVYEAKTNPFVPHAYHVKRRKMD
jgi:hypothetical protein